METIPFTGGAELLAGWSEAVNINWLHVFDCARANIVVNNVWCEMRLHNLLDRSLAVRSKDIPHLHIQSRFLDQLLQRYRHRAKTSKVATNAKRAAGFGRCPSNPTRHYARSIAIAGHDMASSHR